MLDSSSKNFFTTAKNDSNIKFALESRVSNIFNPSDLTSKEKNSSTPKLRSYATYGQRDIGDSISLKLPDTKPKVPIKNKSLREI